VNSYDLDGRVALVTGGASGLGRATVSRLAASGARVAILDRERVDGGVSVTADVTDAEMVARAVDEVEGALGPIDVLVHCAGVGGPWGSAFALDPDEWRRLVDVNLTGSYLVCRRVLPGMAQRGYGRAVLVSSIAGKEGHPLLAAYASAKAGVIALVKSLARELAGTGVLVNAVTPGAFATPMALEQPAQLVERMTTASPLERLGEPAEAAAMIAWLVSEECSFSTGAVFDLSGGRSTA
jgi:NAD(P)-dependent dehydrogenase (short-subunit alcohol dehydrogenase family)